MRRHLSLRSFLGLGLTEGVPEHSSMTRIRQRLPETMFEEVFRFVIAAAVKRGLLRGKTIGVDATTLEANAAMKALVRRDTGEDWKEYLRRLAQAEGIENPTDDELRRFDRKRKGKKVSNKDWESPSDPDSRISKMKDGRTHLAYKAEHAVDLESEFVVAAVVYRGDDADPETLPVTVETARETLERAGSEAAVEEVVADKGYHKTETIQILEESVGVRTYVAEPKLAHRRRWTDKEPGQKEVVYANRRRIRGARGKQLGRWRSERVERSFAHSCETGGARRSWLRGVENVSKRYLAHLAAHNLRLLMLALCGVGTPRALQGAISLALAASVGIIRAAAGLRGVGAVISAFVTLLRLNTSRATRESTSARMVVFSTGC